MSARKIQAELVRQGGLLGALEALAEQVRETADAMAGAIEAVALEIDRERRGALSIAARHDTVELTATIRSLMRTPLLDAESRQALTSQLLRELAPRTRDPEAQRRNPVSSGRSRTRNRKSNG